MKKISLLFLIFLCILIAEGQVNDLEKMESFQLVKNNLEALQLTSEDISNAFIQSTYKNKFAGTTMVYLQQSFKSVPIYNQIQTLAFKNGKLVSLSGERIHNLNKGVNILNEKPSVTAEEAVMAALADRKLKPTERAISISKINNGKKVEFGKLGVSHENITAELMWFPNEEGKPTVKLGWQVYIVQNSSSDYWLVNVDAINKNILSINNLTVYCNWDGPNHLANHDCGDDNLNNSKIQLAKLPWENIFYNKNSLNPGIINSPSIVNSASYRVVPFPAESPIHPGGTPALVTNPWNLSGASNNAVTLKWQSIGTTNYDITRGNNVWAQEDRNGNNGSSSTQVTSSTTPDPLTFDFVPDFTVDPFQSTPVPNQQFNTVNLFYWNNIIHDLTYLYGFDEASRNFQADNLGRGGAQNDFVFADAQDGGGINNANFSTPADGGNGRMQMFLWNAATPNRDGDVDNSIIVHEYAHGISNRLTGNGSSCLSNAEQMGEGWSDYYALMYTQNWATANLNTGFNSPRGLGTYTANQAITGNGIRSQRYTTNFAINNKVYASSIPSSEHARGEIWCAVLWEMTWGIINQVGSINPNLFSPNAVGGNSVALKLVTEGLKLQPCSPGFISSRDAILQADINLYGGLYRCTILEAFRKRGMGLGASQGSSASVTDQIPSFTNGGATLVLIQSGTIAVPEGQNINYTNRVTTDVCSGFTGYTLTDTLPTNVTYVSGGTYNAANRVVSFSVTQAAGTTIDYNFVVSINAGTYFAPVTLLNEPVPSTMPATWSPLTTVPTGGTLWSVSTLQSNSTPNAFFVENEVISTDQRLELTNGILLPTGASSYPKLSFQHRFNTEDQWDGGVAEISTDGGTTWDDLGPKMLTNPYNNTLGVGAGNNLSNRAAFSGLITAFINTTVNLSSFGGQTAKIRFRFASDDNTAGLTGTPTGWFVDDINIINTATVSMRSSLFNASMVRINISDTVTIISQGATTPSLTLTSAAGTNIQTVCVNAAITNIVYSSAGGVTGATVTGLPAGVTGTYSGGVFTISGTPSASGTFSYTITSSGGTPNATATGTITVSALTTLTLTSAAGTASQTVTVSSSITNITYSTTGGVTGVTVTGLPSGVTGTYSGGTNGTVSISGTPTAAGTFNYTVTTTGGCGVQTATGNITVVNGPSITLTSAAGTSTQSVCVNAAITNIVYTAAGGVTGATITGLPAGVTGTYSGGTNGTFTIAGTPSGTGTFTYNITTTGGTAAATATGTITVNGAVTLTLTSAASTTTQTVNINTAITNISYSTTGGVTGVTVTGLPSGVTGTYSGGTNGTVTIGGTPTVAGTFNYTVTTTGGCSTQSRAGTITVVVPASVTLSSAAGTNAQTICIGNAITAITYTTAGGITGASTTGLLAGVTGTYSGGTNGTYTISGTPTAAGTFNYTITSTGTIATATGSITVNALPAAPMVTSPANYCQGATATALTAPGNNLLWYIAATGGTGSTTAPTPNTATTGNTPYYVSQTINGCESPRATILVTINPTPAAPIVTAAVNYCQGGTATALTATGTGTGLLWYTTSTGGTGTATAPTPSTTTAGTTLYYVSQTTGVCEGPRALITVTVSAGPSITVQPSNITSCTTTATFSVTATGTNLTYQWQVSTDGGITYSNIAGATSSSYTISGLTVAQSNNKYRVAVSAAGCSSVTSGAVTARVGTAPTVVLTAAPAVNFNPATNGGLYITVSPVGNYTYQWKRNNVILPLVTSTSITKANGLLDEFGSYQVTVFDVATGCAGVSNTISVSDIAGERNRLFISPNPTRGMLRVSYYSSSTAAQTRMISVYDSKGAKLLTKSFNVAGTYGFMDVDLSNYVSDTYMLILRDASGKKIASESVIKY